MSSLFQGLAVNGKLKTTSGAPVSFFRGLPFAADGGLAIGAGPAVAYTAGIPTNASGQIVASSNAPTQFGPGGLPLDANGAVCFRDEVPTYFHQGVGYGVSNALARGFSPGDLFASGEPGAWYDPSDFSTMWQDAGGSTQVTSVEQPVGLLLDKSQALGPELYVNPVVNGAAPNGPGSISINGSLIVCTCTSVGNFGVIFNNNIVGSAGDSFRIIVRITNKSYAGNVSVDVGNKNTQVSAVNSVVTVGIVNCTGLNRLQIYSSVAGVANDTFTVEVLSVRRIPGNHLIQATAASRPTLRARYNILGFSDLSGGAQGVPPAGWVGGAGNSRPVGTDADGNTIWRQTTASSQTHFDYSGAGVPISVGGVLTAHVRVGTVYSGTATLGNFFGWVGTPVGTVTQYYVNGVSVPSTNIVTSDSIVSMRLTSPTNAGTAKVRLGLGANGVCTGDLEFSRPQVDYGNTGAKPNTYQKTTGANGYATGPQFPPYLDFDGVDDGMATADNVDFTATDKMTVGTGVLKRSDVQPGAIVACSSMEVLSGNTANAPDYRFSCTGSVTTNSRVTATYAAPIANVLSVSYDLAQTVSTSENIPRVNGGPATTTSPGTEAGSGSFKLGPIAIGARVGAGPYLPGQLHGLIVRGAASSAAQISGMESFMASKMGPLAPVLP